MKIFKIIATLVGCVIAPVVSVFLSYSLDVMLTTQKLKLFDFNTCLEGLKVNQKQQQLFMIFTARRKQRAIPVIREPENKSLEFAELIGTLYYQKKDHADLVRKKYLYFAEELRREIQVDVEEVAEDERSFGRIARKTGMEAGEIAVFIREVRPVVYGGRSISEKEMKRLVDKMNEIINHI